MFRVFLLLFSFVLAALAGCAKPISPEELAKLQGGNTKVVVYGFCVPFDHLVQATFTRASLTYIVNDKTIGTMQTCSHATFSVPSGYWSSKFQVAIGFPHTLPPMKFHPGETQYLHMRPAGNGRFHGVWVSKEKADEDIAEINKIGQMF